MASRFWLFPLFLRQWNRTDPDVGRIDLLWPFYSKGRSRDGSEFLAVRPVYSHSQRKHEEQTSYLLGLVGTTEIREAGVHERSWRVLWAGRLGTRQEMGRDVRHVDLWPLYRSLRVREEDGTEQGFVRVPYLIPLRALEPDSWNRNYNQLLELYSRRWRNGEQRSSLLFGLREMRRSSRVSWESWGGFLHFRRRTAVDQN
jgi:hypothetical protein